MLSLDSYDRTLHAIYAAGTTPSLWPDAVRLMADVMQSPFAMLHALSLPSRTIGFTFPHAIPERSLQLWAAFGTDRDPFIAAAQERGLYVDGNVVLGDELVPRSALRRTDFYRELWKSPGLDQLCAGVVFGTSDGLTSPTVMSFYRGPDDPSYGNDEKQLLRRLLPHLARALGVTFHLRQLEIEAASRAAALDATASAVLLLDAQARISRTNRAADALLARGALLKRHAEGGLRCAAGIQGEADLQHLLRAGTSTAEGGPPFTAALVLRNAEGRPVGVVHAAPWRATEEGAARAVAFVYDLANIDLAPATLVRLLGLTPAEARAALTVLGGQGTAAAARGLGISPNTYKTQMRAVYAKTMTARQTDLLKLLLALARS